MINRNNIQRCVHIFPRFEHSTQIDEFRKMHDYLHQYIEPHITLVFPFYSDLLEYDIAADLSRLVSDIKHFEIVCSGFSKLKGRENCIAMNFLDGNDDIYKMHYLVQEGILEPYKSKITANGSYVPHMTIGRFSTEEEMEMAFKKLENQNWKFKTKVMSIFIEEIGKNKESIITNEIYLKK